jgi:hypothetical protein
MKIIMNGNECIMAHHIKSFIREGLEVQFWDVNDMISQIRFINLKESKYIYDELIEFLSNETLSIFNINELIKELNDS